MKPLLRIHRMAPFREVKGCEGEAACLSILETTRHELSQTIVLVNEVLWDKLKENDLDRKL